MGIETDRGPRAAALVAVGYQVYAINPMQAARDRDRFAGGAQTAASAAVSAGLC
jgi:hypothetical protein